MARSVGRALLLFALPVISGGAAASDVSGPTAVSAQLPGAEWRNYNGTLDGQRYSRLKQVNVGNVANLTETCRLQVDRRGAFQSGLIVINGVMYASTAASTIAMDPTTCTVKWRHEYNTSDGHWPINRGVAYYAGRIFRGTDDAHVIALDAETGKEVWQNVVGEFRLGEVISGAPVAWNGLAIVGTATGDVGIRGRIIAFDAATGREVWHFNTVPAEGEKGAETWKDGKWREHGGGGSWSTFTIDPETGELFAPVGNAAPDFSPGDRPGDNLFTNSVVVLDANTGKLRWWYQFTPNDGLDHDLAAAPLLYRSTEGEQRLAAAGKDGYLRIINRRTHRLLSKTPVTTVDPRPQNPTAEGIKVCPGITGGVEWNGPAVDPTTMTIVVGAVDWCSVLQSEPGTKWVPGRLNLGGSWHPVPDRATGWITALNADTGAVRWKYHADAPVVGAITPTAGGITLAGDNGGNFFAFETTTGRLLKQINSRGSISGGVITYAVGGKQYVAFASGNSSRSSFGAVGRPTIVVMEVPNSDRASSGQRQEDVVNGRSLYRASCSFCHGTEGRNVRGVDMQTEKDRKSDQELVEWIKNPSPPMPKVFPEPLDADDEADIRDIVAFLRHWQ
jgi:PQQ-dependent dehydrogenase (methanol/ethanol family)